MTVSTTWLRLPTGTTKRPAAMPKPPYFPIPGTRPISRTATLIPSIASPAHRWASLPIGTARLWLRRGPEPHWKITFKASHCLVMHQYSQNRWRNRQTRQQRAFAGPAMAPSLTGRSPIARLANRSVTLMHRHSVTRSTSCASIAQYSAVAVTFRHDLRPTNDVTQIEVQTGLCRRRRCNGINLMTML